MQSMRRRVAVVSAAVLGAAALTAGLVSAASAGSEAESARGGTYRVGWESTFGWSDSMDPTGEYLANFIAIWTNLLGRNLVGYNHVAGAAGNVPVPDLATAIPKPTNGLKTYTFKLKSGIRFGPPVNREITSTDIRYAIERMGRPKNGAQYAVLLQCHQGLRGVRQGRRNVGLGHQDPEREDDRVQSDEACRRLPEPARLAGGWRHPSGGCEVLRGEAGRIRPLCHRLRAVHDRGLGQARHQLVRRDEADQRV